MWPAGGHHLPREATDSVIPECDPEGNLPPGIFDATWEELVNRYGTTPWRRRLLDGLLSALRALRAAGCRRAYVNGSFVTEKQRPGDFDACWEVAHVDAARLDPVLLDFDDGRAAQKQHFHGELFPAEAKADGDGTTFLMFFQRDRRTGQPKGILAIDLSELP